jgi:hypothetical protein
MPSEHRPSSEITVADLAELAARAVQLASDIGAAHAALRGAEETKALGYMLEDDAGSLRQIARDITDAAGQLGLVLRRSEPGRRNCAAEWGCCPEHGGTLSTRSGRWACTTPGCGRTWDWLIGDLPCLEPAAFTVLDGEGNAMDLCAGHTIEARLRLVGARVLPLRPGEERDR